MSKTTSGNAPSAFVQGVIDALPPACKAGLLSTVSYAGQTALHIRRESMRPLLEHLKTERGFDVLTDVTAVDYLNKEALERFQVIYVLHCRKNFEFLRVQSWVPEDDPRIPTVHDLWRSAGWGERECHDMFGIDFDGAPDMRRLLMPEDYPGFPLLKDYPLKGRGERVQFPKITPSGDEIRVGEVEAYPTTIGRGLHTPAYLKELERDSQPRS